MRRLRYQPCVMNHSISQNGYDQLSESESPESPESSAEASSIAPFFIGGFFRTSSVPSSSSSSTSARQFHADASPSISDLVRQAHGTSIALHLDIPQHNGSCHRYSISR